MRRRISSRAFLITVMLLVIVGSHLPVLYTYFYHNLTGIPKASNYNIDLSGHSSSKSFVLDGEWEFYWNRLIVTEQVKDAMPDFLIQVPDYWSKYQIDGSYLPEYGYASYKLTLKGLIMDKPVTVYLPDFGSAYRVFIDGKLTSESGIVSTIPKEVFTTTKAELFPITLSADKDHDLVIEVATARFSGLYMAPVLKEYDSAVQAISSRNSLRLLLFGAALFSFLVLLIVYILSFHKNKRTVWYPAMGFLLLFRIMLTTEFFSFWQDTVFFHLSYESTNPVMFFVSFAFQYMLIFLVQELLGIPFSGKEKVSLLIYYVTLFLLYYFIPQGVYNRHLTILMPVCTFVMEIYVFFKIYHHRQRMKQYGLIIYGGTAFAIMGFIIDSYYINGSIYLNLSLALLILFTLYLMILGLVSAMSVANIHKDLTIAAVQLAQARSLITMQTDYYDALSAQMNEVRAIRHDVRHFLSVIRNMSGEGRYEELDRILNEYAEKSDTEPLPVFCENIVANSILGYYSLKFRKGGIPFRCVGNIPKQLSVSDSDLCVVLGNALENALEACQKLKGKEEKYVLAEARRVNGLLLFKVENSYNGILTLREGNYLTTKSDGYHGIGLQNVKKVVETYGGYIEIEHSGKTFILMIAFPDPDLGI
ncbi:MAG TPA: GHKL domain-containing protein [Lachnospiraceae bacterium]|nr:GHKL domain-containing protein [Lachnospiraceae bacterium]